MKFFTVGVALLMGVFSFAYAAQIGVGGVPSLGAGTAVVSAPGDVNSLVWTAGDGAVSAVTVNWTPEADSDYTVEVTLMDSGCDAAVTGGGPETKAVTTSGTLARDDEVTGFTASAKAVDCTRVMIVED